jgi:hypothetical protein
MPPCRPGVADPAGSDPGPSGQGINWSWSGLAKIRFGS